MSEAQQKHFMRCSRDVYRLLIHDNWNYRAASAVSANTINHWFTGCASDLTFNLRHL